MRELYDAIYLIKKFEGLHLKAYKDPVGIPTIGWGTIAYPDGSKVKMGDVISKEYAEKLLEHEVLGISLSIGKLFRVEVNNKEFCALVSFCYNLGVGALKKSTLLKKLNAGEPREIVAKEFDKWINAGGKPLKGLIRRRKEEKDLFLS